MSEKNGKGTIVAFIVLINFILVASAGSGCGGKTQEQRVSEVVDAATAFLDACGNQDTAELRSLMSPDYLESSLVPDPITVQDLVAAMGKVNSYRLAPESDVRLEGNRAVVSVAMDIQGKGEKEETLILLRQENTWMVGGFTAMDWTSKPLLPADEQVEVEEALRDFITACIDQKTDYIFKHLSQEYLQKHHLTKPWTASEFSSVFGTARSYDFDVEQIAIDDGKANVDVTIEFGTRGNLESETAQVRLVKKGGQWLIDVFPFFIY